LINLTIENLRSEFSGLVSSYGEDIFPLMPSAYRAVFYLTLRRTIMSAVKKTVREAVSPVVKASVTSVLITCIHDILHYGKRDELISYWSGILDKILEAV